MHLSQSTGPAWLAASLLPFKFYTVVAGFCMLMWHSKLPAPESVHFDARSVAFWLNWDFAITAEYFVAGYFLCAAVLIIGGSVQMFKRLPWPAFFSVAFGISALIIGVLLRPYQWAAEWMTT
jgi:hypothetical protein